MLTERSEADAAGELMVYQIRVEGRLSPQWKDWFEGLTITAEEDGNTLLSGPVTDQAALYGLLRKVRDLALPLLLVIRVEPDRDVRRKKDESGGDE